jgi:hypothetical protein
VRRMRGLIDSAEPFQANGEAFIDRHDFNV